MVLPGVQNPSSYVTVVMLLVHLVRWVVVFPSYEGGWEISRIMCSPARKGADPGFNSDILSP